MVFSLKTLALSTTVSLNLLAFPALAAMDAEATAKREQQIEALAKASDGASLVELAAKLKVGRAVGPENPLLVSQPLKARDLLERALLLPGLHIGEAQLALGKMLLDGKELVPNHERAKALLAEALQNGQGEAAVVLGDHLAKVEGNIAAAKPHLHLAMRLGRLEAAFSLADIEGTPTAATQRLVDAAVAYFTRSANAGDERAAYKLATHFRHSAKTLADWQLARDWYLRSADLGNNRSYYWLGKLHGEENIPLFAPADAVSYLVRSAQTGEIEAAQKLVSDHGRNGPLNVPEDIFQTWGKALFEANDLTGLIYYTDATDLSYQRKTVLSGKLEAMLYAEKPLEISALLRIGRAFLKGDIVIQNPTLAYQFFRKAARSSSPRGTLELANLIVEQPQLSNAADISFLKSKLVTMAEQGDFQAPLLLGNMALRGIGEPASRTAAKIWFDHAAHQEPGSADLRYKLASFYLASSDTKQQINGQIWLQKAIESGSSDAMVDMGSLLASGDLISKDTARAISLFQQAAQLGDSSALIKLGDTAQKERLDGAQSIAYEAYDKALAMGHPLASARMGELLKSQGRRDDAIHYLEPAARAGNLNATLALYDILSNDGQEPDTGKDWLLRAHENLSQPGTSGYDKLSVAKKLLLPTSAEHNRLGLSLLHQLYRSREDGASAALADAYIKGQGTPEDPRRGLEILQAAAERGDFLARLRISDMKMEGRLFERDQSEAVSILKQLVLSQPGNEAVNIRLAGAYRLGKGVRRDLEVSTDYYRRAAQGGSIWGTRDLGLAYMWGRGIEQDKVKALEQLALAARHKLGPAILEVSHFYSSGVGTDIDQATAFAHAYKAAKTGDPESMLDLGMRLLAGAGVPKNSSAGISWLERAAEGKGPMAANAMFELARVYENGVGVDPDISLTNHWMNRAAEAGSRAAIYRVALSLRANGNPDDEAESIKWLQRARDLKHNKSTKLLAQLESQDEFSLTGDVADLQDASINTGE